MIFIKNTWVTCLNTTFLNKIYDISENICKFVFSSIIIVNIYEKRFLTISLLQFADDNL